MENNKSNKRLYTVIVILVTLILALGGFIIYDKLIDNETSDDKLNGKEVSTDDPNKSLNSIAEKYISYVPRDYGPGIDNCVLGINDGACDVEGAKWKDAYTDAKVTIDQISDKLLLRMAIRNSKDVSETDAFEADFKECGEEKCTLDEYYVAQETLDNLYKMYNKSVKAQNFHECGGVVEYKNNYFAVAYGGGCSGAEKINKIEKSEIVNDELLIYERVLFIFSALSSNEDYDVIVGKENYNSTDIIKAYESTSDEEIDYEKIESDAQSLIDSGYLFKHTFKMNDSLNEYYWYSSELIK